MISLKDSIMKAANTYQVSPVLVASIIHVESHGVPNAIRYEPGFYKKYLQNKELTWHIPSSFIVSRNTELFLRSCSLGCMQIMGQVARENGFTGDWLTDLLTDVDLNIDLGTKILYQYLVRNNFEIHSTLLRWNGGSDAGYDTRVITAMQDGDYQSYLIA